MDKLRAIQYFNHAVEHGSFAAAARAADVSTPAVTQLVAALERSLGVTLFNRTTQGLALTADGERYYETSRRIAADLHDVEQRLGPRGAKPRGMLTVGLRASLAHSCVMPRIARFLARYPDIDLSFKPMVTIQEIDEKNVDIAVLIGWPPERDFAVRPLAQTRNFVCASPEYWAREGMPREPEDLRGHRCLIFRSSGGTLLDRWIFEKNGQRRAVDVRTRVFSDDRTWLDTAACAGAGVINATDFSLVRYLSSGQLVRALTDWEGLEAPTIFAVYPRAQRQSKLVRAFLDFLVETFAELESEGALSHAGGARAPRPDYFGRAQGLHSAFAARKQKHLSRGRPAGRF